MAHGVDDVFRRDLHVGQASPRQLDGAYIKAGVFSAGRTSSTGSWSVGDGVSRQRSARRRYGSPEGQPNVPNMSFGLRVSLSCRSGNQPCAASAA